MHGKPSNLSAEEYSAKIERLVSLKGALARADCVESFDVNHDEHGRIRGRVSLRHAEIFYDFNELLGEFPIRVAGIYSTDRIDDSGDDFSKAVEVRVLIVETSR